MAHKTATFKPYYIPGQTAKAFDDTCEYLGVSSAAMLTKMVRREIAPYVNENMRFDPEKARKTQCLSKSK